MLMCQNMHAYLHIFFVKIKDASKRKSRVGFHLDQCTPQLNLFEQPWM